MMRAVWFLAGAYLGMRFLAAAYRPMDLWYAIGREYPLAMRGILGWGAVGCALIAVGDPAQRQAFLWGALAFLSFHFSLFGLRHLVMRRLPPLPPPNPAETRAGTRREPESDGLP